MLGFKLSRHVVLRLDWVRLNDEEVWQADGKVKEEDVVYV